MSFAQHLIQNSPYIALFLTLALGYLVGKITIGRFVLGGVAGTLPSSRFKYRFFLPP